MIFDWIKNSLGLEKGPVEPPKHIDNLALYYFDTCPYCRAVTRQMKRLNISVELRNIHRNEDHLKALMKHGGKRTVPCLLIEKDSKKGKWMYESMDIIAYLNKQYG